MSKVFANINLEGSVSDCDRAFSDKRNQFRGLFDISCVSSDRKGDHWKGNTQYQFFVESDKKDAPVVLSILKELGFKTMYV